MVTNNWNYCPHCGHSLYNQSYPLQQPYITTGLAQTAPYNGNYVQTSFTGQQMESSGTAVVPFTTTTTYNSLKE